MGTVFAATHKNNGSTAAIKILHPEFSRDEDTRSRFLQEGYAANKVNHPGVVRILDDDVTEEGLAYLVMELLQGELLEQRRIRKGGKLPLTEVYEFADQLLDVLAAAHAKGIVHRDIKPDNIFLTSQGKLKVLDFGFAQIKTDYRPEQTATGFLLGTPGFMAPEQAVGNRPLIDARTDIWAVGATMFLLVTGQPVHPGESAAEQLIAAANFPVRPITTLEPGLPTKLAYAIDRALEFDRDHRWPDCRSMQEALRAIPKPGVGGPIRTSIVDERELRAPPPHSGGSASPGRALLDQPVGLDDVTMKDLVDELSREDLELSGETRVATRDSATDEHVALPAFDPNPESGDNDRTIARESPRRAPAAPHAPFKDLRFDDHERSDETLVMDSRPVHHLGLAPPVRPPSAPAHMPPMPPIPPPMPLPPMRLDPRGPVHPSGEIAYIAEAAGEAPQPQRTSRLVVFLVLAGITMAVVIGTGLVVLLTLE
jgi:serine/threonine-protein kinase